MQRCWEEAAAQGKGSKFFRCRNSGRQTESQCVYWKRWCWTEEDLALEMYWLSLLPEAWNSWWAAWRRQSSPLPPLQILFFDCLPIFISKTQFGCLPPSSRNELQNNLLGRWLLRKSSSVTGFTCLLKILSRSIKVPTNCCACKVHCVPRRSLTLAKNPE